ncbi:DUF192 domain-containing protein [Haloarcula onubensis]|uniref:DUF192 domain-containing protein n=1 Tax=Haloarcula onubensis TaxID=2950539 RepID=A0ABU2FJF6_9EURY|nr:DUF192 domain-containing protein [Halomicroarcula sp. S3CR25-11]MDS0280564.1 DUF192 domain-containing protein [Halomicroarcula sp. S3CR25-11]
MARRAVAALVGVIVAVAVAVLAFQTGLWVDVVGVGEYDRGTVTVAGSDNTTPCTAPPNRTAVSACDGSQTLATVDVRIADTQTQRYTGLSDTESLGPNEGMLFVHDQEGEYAYVMRDMAFDIDIIFIDANGTITTVHHASAPPEGESYSERYAGRGKYVLEVNRGWANRTGVGVGDRVELPSGVAGPPA